MVAASNELLGRILRREQRLRLPAEAGIPALECPFTGKVRFDGQHMAVDMYLGNLWLAGFSASYPGGEDLRSLHAWRVRHAAEAKKALAELALTEIHVAGMGAMPVWMVAARREQLANEIAIWRRRRSKTARQRAARLAREHTALTQAFNGWLERETRAQDRLKVVFDDEGRKIRRRPAQKDIEDPFAILDGATNPVAE